MNHAVKLFFDNCLSKKLPKVIHSVFADDHPNLQAKHLTEFFDADDDDSEWLPLLEEDKDWIVITADRGKDPKKEKLPIICSQLKMTHVSLTNTVYQSGFKIHRHALLSLFPIVLLLGDVAKRHQGFPGAKAFSQSQLAMSIGGKSSP